MDGTVGTLATHETAEVLRFHGVSNPRGKTYTWSVPKLGKKASASITSPSFEVHTMWDMRFRLWPKGVDGSPGKATVFLEFRRRDTVDSSTSVLLRSCILTAKFKHKDGVSAVYNPVTARFNHAGANMALIDPSVGDSHWHPVPHFTVSFNSWSCETVSLFIPDSAASNVVCRGRDPLLNGVQQYLLLGEVGRIHPFETIFHPFYLTTLIKNHNFRKYESESCSHQYFYTGSHGSCGHGRIRTRCAAVSERLRWFTCRQGVYS